MTETTEKTVTKSEPATLAPEGRLTKLKAAFLYVLIGGLAAAALTSVAALLIGEFNSAIQKALVTIFIFFTHGLFILAVLWADRYDQVGKSLLPTSLVVLAFANLATTVLGTWELITNETAWRALGLYVLALGGVFMIIGALKLRIAHQATQVALYTTIGLIVATVLSLIPWVLDLFTDPEPLYYRIVAALAILSTTSFLISLILRGIALGHKPELKSTAPAKTPVSTGMMAIYITVGTLVAFVWFVGFIIFASTSLMTSRVDSYTYPDNAPSKSNRL